MPANDESGDILVRRMRYDGGPLAWSQMQQRKGRIAFSQGQNDEVIVAFLLISTTSWMGWGWSLILKSEIWHHGHSTDRSQWEETMYPYCREMVTFTTLGQWVTITRLKCDVWCWGNDREGGEYLFVNGFRRSFWSYSIGCARSYSNDISSPPFNFTKHLAVVLVRVNLDLTSLFIVVLLNV